MTDTETRGTFITKIKTTFNALQDTTASKTSSKRYTHFETACKETAAKVIPLKPKLKNVYPGKQIIFIKPVSYYTRQRDINKINRHQKMSDISMKLKRILYNRMKRNKLITFRIK